MPDVRLGQEVKAYVVLAGGAHLPSAEDIIVHCRERLAAYKYPRLVELRDELPLNAAGKVPKKLLA